jgi:DNA mismatch repair ATPase MutS
MGGKSTILRSVGLIIILAQIGCYIPCEKGEISIVDRIFTRIGARDDIFLGKSTFMIELSEVASVLYHATNKSIFLIDELGSSTSTFDGYSIAYSVVQYLKKINCASLFSTHYHLLTEDYRKDEKIKMGFLFKITFFFSKIFYYFFFK